MLLSTLALLLGPASDTVLVSPAWLEARLDDPRVVVLHAGARSDFEAGHIPGAKLADVMAFHSHDGERLPADAAMAAALARAGVSDRSRVVVYGDGMSAAIVFVALDHLGLGGTSSILDGGLAAWRAAGGPVSRDPSVPRAGSWTPRPSDEVVVDAAWVAARLEAPAVHVLDARTPAEYAGTARESLPRTGHLPGATLLEWVAVTDGGTGRFRSPEELRRLFSGAGVSPGDTVVTYCTVGMRASQLYVAARILGHPTRLYAGSMADWSRRAALPLVTGERPR